jgi:hypothetical protein
MEKNPRVKRRCSAEPIRADGKTAMITDSERAKAIAKSESGGLLNLTELASVFDVGRDFTKQMVRAGFKTFGGRTTREDALAWLRENRDFKTRQEQKSAKSQRNSAIQRRSGAKR